MKLLSSIIILCCLLLVFYTNYSFATNIENHSIEVRGQASIFVEPDSFSLQLAIMQKGRNLPKLKQIVEHKTQKIINAAREVGVNKHNIDSARVMLQVLKERKRHNSTIVEHELTLPNHESSRVYVDALKSKKDKSQSFKLTRNINIKFNTLDEYDNFLAKAFIIGVEYISPLSISIENSQASYEQALKKAIDNAKRKARYMAEQAGMSLGKIIFLQELSNNRHMMSTMSAERLMSSPSQHGSLVTKQPITASVLVKFAIQR